MVALRGRAVVAVVMCVGVALAGCSTPPITETTTSTTETISSSSPPSAAPTRKVELLRLGEIKDAFPPGYVPYPLVGPRTLDAGASRSVGDFVSYGEPLTVAPESCGALLRPVQAATGVEDVSMASGTSSQDPFIAVRADDPVTMRVGVPESGCDQFTFLVDGGGGSNGRAERLTAPSFEDAVTYAVKVVFYVDDSTVEMPFVEYFYTAILDGRTFVNLWARVPSDFSAEPVLPDLLSKTVVALRGQ